MENYISQNFAKNGFIYGTAWKEDVTEDAVMTALKCGYRAIDTANQRQHYYEEGVGRALVRAQSELNLKRSDLFLQTKFTYARGQDHRKPYDETAAFGEQVRQSFESSLAHLQTDFIDSLLLHGPYQPEGLSDADWDVWAEMETLVDEGAVRQIGIANVNAKQLIGLFEGAKVRPAFVQNRCYAAIGWDSEVRAFCLENDIHYQGFSLLTANWKFLGGGILRPADRHVPQLVFAEDNQSADFSERHPALQEIEGRTGKAIQQIIFRFARQIGMIPITGSRSEAHLKLNLEINDFELSEAEMDAIKNLAFAQ